MPNVNPITSDAFVYQKEKKCFIGDMSTVGSAIKGDVLYMKSQWTGKVEPFALKKLDKGNDIWIYYFYAQNPKLDGYYAIIFND